MQELIISHVVFYGTAVIWFGEESSIFVLKRKNVHTVSIIIEQELTCFYRKHLTVCISEPNNVSFDAAILL